MDESIAELTLVAVGFFWFLAFSCVLVPDVIRFFRKRPLRDPGSFWTLARYYADIGEHWKNKPQPWIAVLFAMFFLAGTVVCAVTTIQLTLRLVCR